MRSVKSKGGLTRGRGMNESVRHMCVLTLNYSAYKEHGLKFTALLQERNPFGFEDENLHSL